MLRQTIFLFGTEAPKVYEMLCKDITAKISGLPEKDTHKDKFSTFQFVEVTHDKNQYLIVCVGPDVLNHLQRKGIEDGLKEIFKATNSVVFCIKSLKTRSNCVALASQHYAAFKKIYGKPNKEPDIVHTTPDHQLQLGNLHSPSSRFFKSCLYSMDAKMRNFASHFGFKAEEKKPAIAEKQSQNNLGSMSL